MGSLVLGASSQAADGACYLERIEVPAAHQITRGIPDVIVAVITTGVNYHLPALRPSILVNLSESGGNRESNGLDDDHNGLIDDVYGYNFADDRADPVDRLTLIRNFAKRSSAQGNEACL